MPMSNVPGHLLNDVQCVWKKSQIVGFVSFFVPCLVKSGLPFNKYYLYLEENQGTSRTYFFILSHETRREKRTHTVVHCTPAAHTIYLTGDWASEERQMLKKIYRKKRRTKANESSSVPNNQEVRAVEWKKAQENKKQGRKEGRKEEEEGKKRTKQKNQKQQKGKRTNAPAL